ncbi:lipopolysaccharide biosynthesis protein [Psychromonas sp. Urea-02u-13]|uniref:lipopolysaccharide biosynthesis protein n=1 Tax=Psychromonas sp. Urea-02u-13 TaxID=2058326 RepID=UPI000C329271|nr:lipopolysaccharide biosynthesis protein [Psychromonas sp. Urea-02u-13]PKG37969.1 flippase [Psychromonas sp. Urea-02u-13]
MTLKNKAINGAVWVLFDKIINQAGSFVLLIYLSRILSPSDFGLIAMLAIFLAVAQSLIDSGFSQALIQKSNKVTENDLSTVFYVNLVVSTLLYCLLYVAAPSIATFYQQPELINLSRVLFVVVIINAIALVPRTKLSIAIDFKTQGLINSVSMIVSTIVAVYMVQDGFGYWSLVGMNLSKALISSILLIILSKWHPKWLFSIASFKVLFSFGSKLLVAGVIATTVQNLYSIIIGRYFNATQMGYFQQGFNYTNILSSTLSSVVQGVTYPIMTSIQENEKRLVEVYVKVMGIVTLLTFPVFVGFAAVAEEFVLIFLGEKWSPIIPILIILSFARLITPISSLNMNILNARGRSDLFLKTDLCKIPVIIIALFIAIPYGIVAVAIAQLFSVFISFFINAYYPGKLFGFGGKEQLKQIFPIAIASLIMYLSIAFIQFGSLEIQMFTKIFVGASVYILTCWFFKITAFTDASSIIRSRLKKQDN